MVFRMEIKKQSDKNTKDLNWQIIKICLIIMVLIIIISILLHHYDNKMSFISDMISSGFFAIVLSQFYILWKKKSEEEKDKCEYLDMSCKYQTHLKKITHSVSHPNSVVNPLVVETIGSVL